MTRWRKRMKGRRGGGKVGECGSATGVHESSRSVGRQQCSAVRWWRRWSAVNGRRDVRAAELGCVRQMADPAATRSSPALASPPSASH
ncbi:hypothetical protein DAI22_10g033800 [Oryza sativa Japonica Group]|nr:hypothetical protein DAI22_10g033800 [Oryza sativa Japonica Group]